MPDQPVAAAPLRRLPLFFSVLLLGSPTASAEWGKPYFGSTPVGSWATYATKSSVGAPSVTTSTRLDDRQGRVRLEDRTTYPGKEYPPSAQRFELAGTFNIQSDLFDFARWLAASSSSTNGGAFEPMSAGVVKTMKDMAVPVGSLAVFVKSETVEGKECDHYTYSAPGPAQGQVETGDLWLSDAVPFGVVRRTSTHKDQSGRVVWSMEQSLIDSGMTPKAATPAVGKRPVNRALKKKR